MVPSYEKCDFKDSRKDRGSRRHPIAEDLSDLVRLRALRLMAKGWIHGWGGRLPYSESRFEFPFGMLGHLEIPTLTMLRRQSFSFIALAMKTSHRIWILPCNQTSFGTSLWYQPSLDPWLKVRGGRGGEGGRIHEKWGWANKSISQCGWS